MILSGQSAQSAVSVVSLFTFAVAGRVLSAAAYVRKTAPRTANPGQRATLIVLAVFAVLAFAHESYATLGESAGSVESDRAVLAAEPAVTSSGGIYTVREIISSSAAVREYISRSGVVFAIAWNGLATPDLDQLLGAYADEYRKAREQTPHQKGARHLQVKSQNVTFEKWGHMRALHGRAYISALIPPGVSTDEIK